MLAFFPYGNRFYLLDRCGFRYSVNNLIIYVAYCQRAPGWYDLQ